MESGGVLSEIRAYVQESFAVEGEEISDEQPLLGEVLDSVGVLNLANHLEETYGITIGAHEMHPANFGTLKAIAAFVARKSSGR